jgi:hypothetical protein
MAIAEMLLTDAKAQVPLSSSAITSASASVDSGALPPDPRGKSTLMGGEIPHVDAVRDELTLKVFGQRPVKILFDERTQVFRDGKRIPLSELRPEDHASIQTVLDGASVFALSIHMLSHWPEGEYQGQVLNFNPLTSELTVSGALSHEPIKLLVPVSTVFHREGQTSFSDVPSGTADLQMGALISVAFESDKKGKGVASRIAILATPGSAFIFTGNISSLDTHSGLLFLVDPRDDKNYAIAFDSAHFPTSQKLHEGDFVRVAATFDGKRYVASAIAVSSAQENVRLQGDSE